MANTVYKIIVSDVFFLAIKPLHIGAMQSVGLVSIGVVDCANAISIL
jgi:hypothetical protein